MLSSVLKTIIIKIIIRILTTTATKDLSTPFSSNVDQGDCLWPFGNP